MTRARYGRHSGGERSRDLACRATADTGRIARGAVRLLLASTLAATAIAAAVGVSFRGPPRWREARTGRPHPSRLARDRLGSPLRRRRRPVDRRRTAPVQPAHAGELVPLAG